jgi:hypothetical protein
MGAYLWISFQTDRILVYSDRLSRRQMLSYDNKVEWYTDWEKVLKELETVQGDDANVAVYPYGKIQFDSTKNPLSI